ncbi:MAG: hypothetical protein JST04_09500 [Bdellovibrionales bacterium]|nr:hypothetical protein [Bdellovibrionales bacterium]
MAKTLLFAAAISIVAATTTAFGDEVPGQFSDEHAAIGKRNGVSYRIGPIDPDSVTVSAPAPSPLPSVSPSPVASSGGTSGTVGSGTQPDLAGLSAALSAMIFGKDRSIMEAQAGMTDLLEGESDFYWGGFKVWNSKPEWKDGAFQIAAGLPTVTMRAPLVRLPVGPVTLAVDAGVAAEANVTAKLAPLISLPIQFTSVKATLEPDVSASGFIEGYAQWLIIRAGIGGELELIRADAKVSGLVSFGAYPPTFAFEGFLNLLAGKIYGFVDYFNLFGWKWKRALQPVFANWKGKCIALSKTTGGADPCAASTP